MVPRFLLYVDGRTLLLASALVALAFTPLMLWMRRLRRLHPGDALWAAAEFSLGIVCLTQVFRGMIPNLIPILTTNVFLCVTQILLVESLYRFTGRRARRMLVYALTGIYFLLILFFTFAQADLRTRSILMSVFMAAISAYLAWPVLGPAPEGCRLGYRFAAGVFLAHTVVASLRVVYLLRSSPFYAVFPGTAADPLYFFFILLYILPSEQWASYCRPDRGKRGA